MTERLAVVLTTIQEPTSSVERLVAAAARAGAETIVVGDRKGPRGWDLPGTRLLGIEDQLRAPYALARLLPEGHYARKNVGFLQAIADGAGCIYETDDDNHPLPTWTPRAPRVEAETVEAAGWFNVYSRFTREHVWPRGLPLDQVRSAPPATFGPPVALDAPIQQGLADGSPDVDAVWRLVLDRDLRFDRAPSLALRPGTWCPFNSQSTWWWAPAFPLLYLPSHCSFRMTDIWRSLVAQRCLWALGGAVVFHAPEVEQLRNAHVLTRDFEQELPGYLGNAKIARILAGLPLAPGADRVGENLARCWEALAAEGFVDRRELELVAAWNQDLAALARGRGPRRSASTADADPRYPARAP